jgi:transcriptional regulator with XRE-family HTH domain
MTESIHIGRKISKIRELRDMKQETLAALLGTSQQAVSKIELSDQVDDDILDKIAEALGVTAEGIRAFNEETLFNIIGNDYHDNSASVQYQCTFNPIEKIMGLFEENKNLYAQLLDSEREKVALLKQIVEKHDLR